MRSFIHSFIHLDIGLSKIIKSELSLLEILQKPNFASSVLLHFSARNFKWC